MKPSRKILIVEDNMVFSMILERMLVRLNINCLGVAKTEEEAIRIATEKKPDLIVMDIDLAKGNGISAAMNIKKSQNIPIIFTTGAISEDQARSEIQPNDHFLGKPFLFEELEHSINQLLAKI